MDRDNFCYGTVSPSVLLAARDYYDSKDIEDPNCQGHIIEYGEYDLVAEKYSFIAFE